MLTGQGFGNTDHGKTQVLAEFADGFMRLRGGLPHGLSVPGSWQKRDLDV